VLALIGRTWAYASAILCLGVVVVGVRALRRVGRRPTYEGWTLRRWERVLVRVSIVFGMLLALAYAGCMVLGASMEDSLG
jgi:hypothetical protein